MESEVGVKGPFDNKLNINNICIKNIQFLLMSSEEETNCMVKMGKKRFTILKLVTPRSGDIVFEGHCMVITWNM